RPPPFDWPRLLHANHQFAGWVLVLDHRAAALVFGEQDRGGGGGVLASEMPSAPPAGKNGWGQYPPRARRGRSACRRRWESHSRTPYPTAKPKITAMAISSIDHSPFSGRSSPAQRDASYHTCHR